jgi:Xaa-Pro aminopeptidase
MLPAAPERIRNGTMTWPYRQDSDFLYLTGFHEPEAVLFLLPGRPEGEVVLFCRESEARRDLYDGPCLGPAAAPAMLGVDQAFPIGALGELAPGLLDGRRRLHYPLAREDALDRQVLDWIRHLRARARAGASAPAELASHEALLHPLRLVKDAHELRQLREAAATAAAAQVAMMRATRPGTTEALLEGVYLAELRRRQAVPSYSPIIAGGAAACTLHYTRNDARLDAGSLLLVDAGAEVAGYAADITRTWPVSGRYSDAQRLLYQIVLGAQQAAIDIVHPGLPWSALQQHAVAALVGGLIGLGWLHGAPERVIAEGGWRRWFPHGLGHWLGLDVHDVGSYVVDGEARRLAPGMVFTIEPGLYVRPDDSTVPAEFRGIGIRIEDDIVVTASGAEVLTTGVPKAIDAVEALVGRS